MGITEDNRPNNTDTKKNNIFSAISTIDNTKGKIEINTINRPRLSMEFITHLYPLF